MARDSTDAPNVKRIVSEDAPTPISDELGRLRRTLEEHCPDQSTIRFEYDGRLKLHIEVMRFEEVALVESILPELSGGIFQDVQRGMVGSHSFHHRITALVNR